MLNNLKDLIDATLFPHPGPEPTPRQIAKAIAVWTEAELDVFLSWTDKASYLAWVADWKATYAALTAHIRGEDQLYREWVGRGYVEGRIVEQTFRYPLREPQQRWLAHLLLALRAYGKRKSWAMKQQARDKQLA